MDIHSQSVDADRPDTHAKALAVNLDQSIYGSFAEIGAGQEVARWFLSVGGASGTVAETISAYDKTFSDETYGSGTRYVSRERLLRMLDREYALLVQRLGPSRGSTTRFFAFADTVAARNYTGDNRQHGWVGLRFQAAPGAEPNDILIHVNLNGPSAQQQQQSLGVLGVNLIHGAFFEHADPSALLDALWEDLSLEQFELDVLEPSGPVFHDADPRRWSLEMLWRGMSHALMFTTEAKLVEPSEILHKRPLVIDRGRFETTAPYHAGMIRAALRALHDEGTTFEHDPVAIAEMSVRPIGKAPPRDLSGLLEYITRVCRSCPLLVTDYAEQYHLVAYLQRYTREPLRFVVGVSLLAKLLEDRFYQSLPGALLEGLGKVFAHNVRVYSYPMPRADVESAIAGAPDTVRLADPAVGRADAEVNADDLRCKPPVNHLLAYLRSGGWVVPIEKA